MPLRLTGNRLGQVVVPSAAGALALGTGAAGVLWLTAALAAVGASSRRIPTSSPGPWVGLPRAVDPAALAAVAAFVERLKASGFVADELACGGVEASVA